MRFFFFFKQKTAYEMRISDWSSDVCSSDLLSVHAECRAPARCIEARVRHLKRAVSRHARSLEMSLLSQRTRNPSIRSLRDHSEGTGVSIVREIGRASCRERVCKYV